MVKFKTMDANEAVSGVAYKFSEMCGIYPITPASPMAEHVDEMRVHGEVNCFGNSVDVVEMQSEAGAVATVHGALQSGNSPAYLARQCVRIFHRCGNGACL